MVATRTTSEARSPPTTEMRARSNTEMVSATPRATATTLATTARSIESMRVRTSEATTFWPTRVRGRSDRRKVPTWIDVLRRLPRDENTLPRRPMAAGTSTSSPGRRSKVPVIEPRTAPASRLVELFRQSETRLWRAPSVLGPRSASSRRVRSIGRTTLRARRIGTATVVPTLAPTLIACRGSCRGGVRSPARGRGGRARRRNGGREARGPGAAPSRTGRRRTGVGSDEPPAAPSAGPRRR